MKSWITKVTGCLSILYGIALIIYSQDITQGMPYIIGGGGMLGIGRKIDRLGGQGGSLLCP